MVIFMLLLSHLCFNHSNTSTVTHLDCLEVTVQVRDLSDGRALSVPLYFLFLNQQKWNGLGIKLSYLPVMHQT